MTIFGHNLQNLYQKHFNSSKYSEFNSGFNNPKVTAISQEIKSTDETIANGDPGFIPMPEYAEWEAINIYHDQHESWHHSTERKQDIINNIFQGINSRLEEG